MSTEAEMAEQIDNNATEEPAAAEATELEIASAPPKDEPPTDETAENDDGELYDEETFLMPDDELFDGSTHSFAINYGKTKNFDGCLIGYFVIIVQFVLYGVVASDVFDGLSGGDFAIPVQVQFGKSCTEMKDVTKDGETVSQPANLRKYHLLIHFNSLLLLRPLIGNGLISNISPSLLKNLCMI